MRPDFRFPPYEHQQREWDENRDKRSHALLWQMRTGKTKAAIDLSCYWHEEYDIDGVIVFAPNGVHENWIRRELVKHHWNRIPHNKVAYGTDLTRNSVWDARFEKMLDSNKFMWLAVNSESMIRPQARNILKRFMKKKSHFMIIFDEAHDFRIPGAKRTKMARSLAPHAAGIRTLTGTAVLNSPLHAFSEYELLKKGALGFDTFGDFKNKFAVFKKVVMKDDEGRPKYNGRKFLKLVDYQNLDVLQKRMAKYSSIVLREDCEDLPEIVEDVRYVSLNKEQIRIYRELHKKFTVDIDKEEVSIGENTIRMMKLQQVLSGFVIDEYGEVHRIPGKNPKIEAMVEELRDANGKTIIWCQFREDIRMVRERLTKEKIRFVEYHGAVKQSIRQDAIDAFQTDKKIDVFLGQPASGGQGLDLSAAHHVLWFSHTFNTIHRKQAEERATAMGGHKITMVDLVVPNSVDEYIRAKVAKNVSISSELAGRSMRKLLENTRI